jgi:UDP-galactopyranose mutase
MRASVIGCGLAGITAALILKRKGWQVSVFETRNHIGGNCHDSNLYGTMVHNYGPHIFHTDDEEVFSLLSEHTEWLDIKYKPKGDTELGLISLPYSKKTISEIGKELTQDEIIKYIFKDYSEKQWGVPFNKISKSIISRIPNVSTEEDPTWYGNQKYQCVPKFGYTKMFESMLDEINVYLCSSKDEWKDFNADLFVWTGPIDSFFDYCYGKLPYRTLDFKHEITKDKLPYIAINQNNTRNKYTRIYDHSYFTYRHKGLTCITKEFSREYRDGDIPFYPIPFMENIALYNKYKQLTKDFPNFVFLGRLATYKYMDMWTVVKQVLNKLKTL